MLEVYFLFYSAHMLEPCEEGLCGRRECSPEVMEIMVERRRMGGLLISGSFWVSFAAKGGIPTNVSRLVSGRRVRYSRWGDVDPSPGVWWAVGSLSVV